MQQKTGVGQSKQAANKENTNQREEAGSIPSNILSIPFKSAVSSWFSVWPSGSWSA